MTSTVINCLQSDGNKPCHVLKRFEVAQVKSDKKTVECLLIRVDCNHCLTKIDIATEFVKLDEVKCVLTLVKGVLCVE